MSLLLNGQLEPLSLRLKLPLQLRVDSCQCLKLSLYTKDFDTELREELQLCRPAVLPRLSCSAGNLARQRHGQTACYRQTNWTDNITLAKLTSCQCTRSATAMTASMQCASGHRSASNPDEMSAPQCESISRQRLGTSIRGCYFRQIPKLMECSLPLLTLLTWLKNARLGLSNLRHITTTFAQLTQAYNITTAPAGCSLWPRSSASPLPDRQSWHVWTPPSAAALLRLQQHTC